MTPWLLLACGLAMLAGCGWVRDAWLRRLAQGLGVLVAVSGGLMLLRQRGAPAVLPGYGPRRWHQP